MANPLIGAESEDVMRPTPHPPPGGSRRGRRLLVLLSTLAVMLAAQPLPAAGAAESAGPGAAGLPATTAAGAAYPITLITGDLVMLQVAPDGTQAARLAEPATDRPSKPPRIYESDGEVHVIPAEAEPYLSSGVLDERLFNVTALARLGYDDVTVPTCRCCWGPRTTRPGRPRSRPVPGRYGSWTASMPCR